MDITGRLDGFMVRYRYRTTEAYTLHCCYSAV